MSKKTYYSVKRYLQVREPMRTRAHQHAKREESSSESTSVNPASRCSSSIAFSIFDRASTSPVPDALILPSFLGAAGDMNNRHHKSITRRLSTPSGWGHAE